MKTKHAQSGELLYEYNITRRAARGMGYLIIQKLQLSINIIFDMEHYCIHIIVMIKKLIKHGNSSALIIDKPILELLNINDETPLEIITDGKNLIISPQLDEQAEEKVKNSLEKINRKFGKTLSKLAK